MKQLEKYPLDVKFAIYAAAMESKHGSIVRPGYMNFQATVAGVIAEWIVSYNHASRSVTVAYKADYKGDQPAVIESFELTSL